LAFGSIGARANLIGMASHHHAAAIAVKDIRTSANGVRSEISFVLRALIVCRPLEKRRRVFGGRPIFPFWTGRTANKAQLMKARVAPPGAGGTGPRLRQSGYLTGIGVAELLAGELPRVTDVMALL
jgi:hypothetical protein